ncbi:MAG: class I SAM-dependent methyltransferase [Proteobacteria bacterium]|nr:class I SAM-dependent methyltransferase [Pseudomonadota bacterium]NBS06007.1 class I SAM-dependent methyltransferase [Verrucomicrobiota bacterium]NBS49134.1 class I SAM-dependent methyltransferase [Verrucomicrobiota bacterium]NBS78447.1 class I SAM-dependent methyltransferase [bacterium]
MCLRLVRCLKCDLIYAPSHPKLSFLRKAYRKANFDTSSEALYAAQTYANAISPFVARLSHKFAAVDVGAGNGALLPFLLKMGFNTAVGIEPSRAALDAAVPSVRSKLREGVFSYEIVADLKISLICSFMILEHIENPVKYIRTAWDLLENSGIIVIAVHNWRASVNRLLGLRSPIIDIEHLQLYSDKSINKLLSCNGFRILENKTYKNTYPLTYWVRLAPVENNIKKVICYGLKRLGISESPLSLNVGNLFAVGIKDGEKK